MIFSETQLAGAFLITPERITDKRGFFARSWCTQEFAARGLNPQLVQCNISFNQRKGTLRGMHYQVAPHEETKLVRCTAGALYDVILDIRPASPTFGQWTAVELTADNRTLLYIPPGFAHGFQTLADDTEVFYQMAAFYAPECARGIRWDDPVVGITWPLGVEIISTKDLQYPAFTR